MHAAEREKVIVEAMRGTGFVTYRELEALLDASPATIRRDLARLEDVGAIVRVHGGAKLPGDGARAPVAVLGCLYLFFSLSFYTLALFAGWAIFGLVVYFTYSRSRSHVGLGRVEVHEEDADIPPQPVPPLPGGIDIND